MRPGRWIGNRSRLPFSVVLSLRSQLLHQRMPTVLTVLALAASVGLASSVEMASRSVDSALHQTVESLVGSAQLEVSAGDQGVPEALIEPIRAVPGVLSAAPTIQRTFRVAEGEAAGTAIRVLGIDLLYDSEVRNYQVESVGFVVRDPIRLVAVPGSVVVSAGMAERLALEEGDVLRVRSAEGEYELRVRGFLTGTLARAYGGQIAVMDVFGLQDILGSDRRVDRIDIAVAPGVDLDAATTAIQEQIGDAATVQPSRVRRSRLESIMSALNVSIWSITLLGVFLGLLLTFAVTSLSVDRRVEELALLRAAGMSGRHVSLLIVLDVLLLAAVGTALGFLAAAYLADSLVGVFSRAWTYLEHTNIQPLEPRLTTFLVALLVGVPVALVASLEPAVRAGSRATLDVLQSYRVPPSAQDVSPASLAAAFAAAMLCLAAWSLPEYLSETPRLVSVMVFGIVAIALGVPQLVLLLFPLLQRVLGRLVPRVGYLVASSLFMRPVETGITVAVWAAVIGGLMAGFTVIHSVSSSIDEYWIGLQGDDAVEIFAQDPLKTTDRELVRRDTIETIRSTPGVLGIAEYYLVETLVQGESVPVESLAIRELAARSGGARTLSKDPEQVIEALMRGELAMNGAFARRFGVEVGDELTLATAHGPHAFRIGAVARAYMGPLGVLFADIETFERWFEAPGAGNVAIWTDLPREPVLDRITRRVPQQALFYRYGENFRRHTALVLEKFNDLLMIPVGLIGLIGVLALMNLLFGNVVARRRELVILRGSGATPANVRATVVLNGLAMGCVGTVVGLLLGQVWSSVMEDNVGLALGYEIFEHVNLRAAGALALGAIGVSVLVPALGLGGRAHPGVGI